MAESKSQKKPTPTQREIARRTSDETEEGADRFTKVISAGIPFESANWPACDHSANMSHVVQEAINSGLRIIGEVTFDGAKPNPQAPETSTWLRYSAPAIPANLVGTEEGQTVSVNEVVGPRDFQS